MSQFYRRTDPTVNCLVRGCLKTRPALGAPIGWLCEDHYRETVPAGQTTPEQVAVAEKRLTAAIATSVRYRDIRTDDVAVVLTALDAERRAREEAEREQAWVREKLGLPKDTPLVSGEDRTLAGRMHVVCHQSDCYADMCKEWKGACEKIAAAEAKLAVAVREIRASRILDTERDRCRYPGPGLKLRLGLATHLLLVARAATDAAGIGENKP